MNVEETQAMPPRAPPARPPSRRSVFVPLLLLGLAVLGWSAFQTQQLWTGRTKLNEAIASQDQQIEQGLKLRAAWTSLVTRTARLAQAGNANASVIVEELRRRGVAVDAETPLPPPAVEPAGVPPVIPGQ